MRCDGTDFEFVFSDDDTLDFSVRLLLAKGMNPNTMDNSGKSPLFIATKTRSESLVLLLLTNGSLSFFVTRFL